MRNMFRSASVTHRGSHRPAKVKLFRRLALIEQLEQRIVFNTYWVTNLGDAGVGTLRAAIESANVTQGEDTIRFRGNIRGDINLQSQLTITDDTKIYGLPNRDFAINGNGLTRVLQVNAGADVRIKEMTIKNGLTQDVIGGAGILNFGHLELVNSKVTGNRALAAASSSASGVGGGIRNRGELHLVNTEVSNNFANFLGGGIQNDTGNQHGLTGNTAADVVAEFSSIVGNESGGQRLGLSSIRGEGGGISNQGSFESTAVVAHVAVRDSTVSNNKTGGDGAGIRSVSNSKLEVEYSRISGNVATSFGTGGIASGDNEMRIAGSRITDNKGTVGGVYLFSYGSPTRNVLISHSEIARNETTNEFSFGAIASEGSGVTLRIEDSSITDNRGGGAGALFLVFTPTEIIRTTISGNSGTYAGGIRSGSSAPLRIDSSTISNNTAQPLEFYPFGAGGILGNAQLVNSTVSGNVLDSQDMLVFPPDYYYASTAAGGWLAEVATNGLASTVESSTVAFNKVVNAPAGVQAAGGILGRFFDFEYYGYSYSGSADVVGRNTIIARNEVNGQANDVFGSFASLGHNLIGVLPDTATGFVASDLRGTLAQPLDPMLGPLANNGGATQTHRLRHRSPAINAGDSSDAPALDQRGYQRIALGTVDIGAYEFLSRPERFDCALSDLWSEFDRRRDRLLSLIRSVMHE